MVAQDTPLISVVVPVFEVAAQVAEAIASLRAQTLADFEVLVIDDGSTDGSGAAARAAIGDDPRFRVIRQANRGLSGARNTGLAQARGAFIAFLDGDDALEPGFLQALHAAILREGTDWAACAVRLEFAAGVTEDHAAMHGVAAPGTPCRLPLTDARAVARLFPSAWNKLCRRALFDSLRFPEGSWFEDHEVFWSLAARTRAIAWVPGALYRHRRDRPGQITGTDSDRVFEQLGVLDRLHPAILGSGLDAAGEGYARIATRLVHERLLVLRDPDRRARFVAATRALFDRLGVDWTPDWDPEISRAAGLALAGVLPLSLVVLGDPGPVLAALEGQNMGEFELAVVGQRAPEDSAAGRPVLRIDPRGLTPAALAERLAGRWVLMLAPGEAPLPEGLMQLVNLGEATGTRLAIGALQRQGAGYHDGWTDNRLVPGLEALPVYGGTLTLDPAAALRLHPVLGNRLIRRDLLAALPDLPVAGDAVSVAALMLASARAAGQAGYTRLAVLSAPDGPPGPGIVTAWRRLRALPADPALPRGWRGTLLLRQARAQGGGWRWPVAMLLALVSGWLPGSAAARADPESPRWVKLCLRPFYRGP